MADTTEMTVDEAVCAILSEYGVEYVFGMRIYTDLDVTRTKPIGVHYEASAELMAYGFARVSGKPGVCAINRPGTPNALMGLAEASNSSVPIIVLLDGLPAAMEGKNALYAYDQVSMMRPLAKSVEVVDVPSQMPDKLRRAFRIATSGRPGPVVVIPRGIASQRIPDPALFAEEQFAAFPATRIAPDPALVLQAVRLLMDAERPCIVAGGGVNLSRAWEELRAFADVAQIPVATTISGKGAFSEHDSLSVGAVGDIQGGRLGRGRVAAKIVRESDVVLLVGTRTNQMATNGWTVPDPASTIIHVDIDPNEIGRNYTTALGIVADAKLALSALTTALGEQGYEPPVSRKGEIAQLLDEWARDNREGEASDAVPIQPARLIKEIRPFIGPDTILVSDGSSPFMWASSHLKVDAGPTFISPRGTGAIGTGLPMAIGAQLAAPEKRVICLEGDGGLMCGILGELEVAARYRLPITVVVFNNGSLLHEKNRMKGELRDHMDFLPGLDFAMIARGLGCEGIRVERPEDLGGAIEAAVHSSATTVLDVVIDPDQGFPGAPR
ncbi:MAG: thiamine pyrophosphate-binding protein [Chloroflexi bacterium]|nr:thiamine pyrophosphate-binding protein [Chloroflexota bacterium]